MTVVNLVAISARNETKPLLNDSSRPDGGERIRGGPAWIRSDRYTIDAKAEGASSDRMMAGPMLGALLEERFQLKTHRGEEQIPMYALTVANGGPKLKPMEEGGCTLLDPANPPPPRFAAPGEKLLCGFVQDSGGATRVILDAGGVRFSRLADELSNILDRHVIDTTGITGIFNIHLEFARDEATRRPLPGGAPLVDAPPDDPASGPSIFTAVQQQLGLKLDSIRESAEFVVIDQVEKPSGN